MSEISITGVYTKTLYRNEANEYSVFKLELTCLVPDYDGVNIVCRGSIPSSLISFPLKLTGCLTKDKDFKFTSCKPYTQDEDEAVEFLSGDLFKGISEKTAQAIVSVAGDDIFGFLSGPDAYEKLIEIDGIGPGKAKIILDVIKVYQYQREFFDYIKAHGGSVLAAEKIFSVNRKSSMEVLKKNPYKVGMDAGMSFSLCDSIAKENGTDYAEPQRVKALIMTAVNRVYESGDTYIECERLLNGVDYYNSNESSYPSDKLSDWLIIATAENMTELISRQEDNTIRYYLSYSYFNEKKIAENITRIQNSSSKFSYNIKKLTGECEMELGIKYSEKQKECFGFLQSEGIKIITGGPGTGKSTIINGIIHVFNKLHPGCRIVTMAPTGRAAQRIKEITGRTSGTIHRMLGILPTENGLLKSNYYANYQADLLIIDEASMMDNEIAAMTLQAVANHTTVIFVGDVDQLPSVGAGNFLKELISSECLDFVRLDINYRQTEMSAIALNAEKIKVSLMERVFGNPKQKYKNDEDFSLIQSSDFHVIVCESENEIASKAVAKFNELYNKKDLYGVQILCSSKGGPAGAIRINEATQSKVNKNPTIVKDGVTSYRRGDRVMIVHNNSSKGCYNGDIGLFTDYINGVATLKINDEDVNYDKSEFDEMTLAYACTIHKSQGSQYDNVIICLPPNPSNMLRRNLLYTAITRAKKAVYIFTGPECIKEAVARNIDVKRRSAVSEKIKEYRKR